VDKWPVEKLSVLEWGKEEEDLAGEEEEKGSTVDASVCFIVDWKRTRRGGWKLVDQGNGAWGR